MEDKFSKGSEWRKWDLHVHTPLSIFQKYGGDKDEVWNKYIEDLEKISNDFSVLGINDYFFLDGYEKLKKEQNKNNRLKNVKLLPVVEFRIEKFAGVEFENLKRINLHVIFSEELSVETIQSQFLNTLEQSYTLEKDGEKWTRSITKESVEELGKKVKESVPESELSKYGSDVDEGFNNLNVDEKKIFESLKKDCFKDKYLIAIGKTEWEQLKWSDASIATKKSIINNANIIFTASESVDSFRKAKQSLVDHGFDKTILLDCSDSHYYSNSKEKDRIGNCFTWIKADPVFEGLKQITYEYDERVSIQKESPEFDFNKPYFESIKINDDIDVYDEDEDALKIEKAIIPLNKNLVTIIGGRGEGKSTIINYLGNSLNQLDEGNFKLTNNNNFSIEYHKINDKDISNEDKQIFLSSDKENNILDFVFIKQGYLKEKTEKYLSNTLKDILNIKNAHFSGDLNNKIFELRKSIEEIEEWNNEKDENGNLINSKEFQENIREKNNKFLENLKDSKNKEKIEDYNTNLKKISKHNYIIGVAKELLNKTNSFIVDVDSLLKGKNKEAIFEKPELVEYKSKLEEIKSSYQKKIKDIEEENENIKNELLESGISGDLTSLLEKTIYYQNIIDDSDIKIDKINFNENRLIVLKQDRSDLGKKIKKEYERQENEINNGWKEFLDKHSAEKQELIKDILLKDDKITVEGRVVFDEDIFYDLLWNSLHHGVHKKDQLKNEFKITDLGSWGEYIEKDFNKKYDSLNHKKKEFISLFFSTEERSKYLRTEAEVKYDGRPISKLSAGQRGTAYLRIHLANSAFDKPIIFDQPEDDLDNKFIVDELIDIFKKLKKYRQIIIVTHNANLVVNTDAEQIIIAKHENETLSYISGSLENKKIRDNICGILEGGKEAFDKRKKKYNF